MTRITTEQIEKLNLDDLGYCKACDVYAPTGSRQCPMCGTTAPKPIADGTVTNEVVAVLRRAGLDVTRVCDAIAEFEVGTTLVQIRVECTDIP